jgi:hypothetical protein
MREKHGMTGTLTYAAWASIRCRVACKKREYYQRGIKICERWNSFTNFLADMGERPSKAHSVDRIDNDGHYEPGNCRWATPKEQQNNRRNNHIIEAEGLRLTLQQWAERSRLTPNCIEKRLKKGVSAHIAVTARSHTLKGRPLQAAIDEARGGK